MTYLLDTNVCLDFLLARSGPVARRVEAKYGALVVSAITAAELRVGNKESGDPVEDARNVDRFLSGVDVAAFDDAAASAYGLLIQVTAVVRGSFDRLIAAHALTLGSTLVTNNERDFRDVPGLRVENWRRT